MATLLSNGASAFGGTNGSNGLSNGHVLPKILGALEVVYNTRSAKDARDDAQNFLESVKTLKEGPSHGYTLASDKQQDPVVRYHGLSLLEHCIIHKWDQYGSEEAACLRAWVLDLAEHISRADPQYIRNKIAQLWVEVAKRCWGAEWMDMDAMLVQLWQLPGFGVHKELVLAVLGSISEEVIGGDDPVVAARETILDKAVVDIFMSAAVIAEDFPSRQPGAPVRFGDEGWFQRAVALLSECMASDMQNEEVRVCATKTLSVLTIILPWTFPNAVIQSNAVRCLYDGLVASHVAVQKGSLDSLHSLYSRGGFSDQQFMTLVMPMYEKQCVERFSQLFVWSNVDAEDIDDDKYLFAKKFSETISHLGNYLDKKFHCLHSDADVQPFLQFFLQVVQSQSLVVSIPVLATWTKLLNNRSLGPSIVKTPLVAPLLEVCSSRLVRYENLPEDTQDPTLMLLLEDTDTIPERHAFLGNYRRYGSQIIETIVELTPSAAITHILGQTEHVLQHLYEGLPPFDPAQYTKNSMPYLRVDAQFTVIESALKGYVKSRQPRNVTEEEIAQFNMERTQLEKNLEAWCKRLIDMNFDDPMIRKRVLQLLAAFSTTALRKNSNFMLVVLEHILVTWQAAQPEHRYFNEAIKELQGESVTELQRLAYKMPDNLLSVFDDLERKIQQMSASGTLDERRLVNYKSFLFIIIHRANNLDQDSRLQRLKQFVEPLQAQWRNEGLQRALESYAGFCEMICLDKAQRYLAERRVHQIADWGSIELDAEGAALQAQMEERQQLLPLRATKTFLNFSVDKIDKSTPAYQASCALWQDSFPTILPQLLKFLTYAHASANPRNWALLPNEMQSIVDRVLTDRFWQAGISEGSKEDFYARVINKKNTLEGLASSIRGTIRYVREFCYSIIYCMSCLEKQFYGFEELPEPLAHALFADSCGLSSHQLIALLNLVRLLVDVCPVEYRNHFLPPILAACFRQMDSKIKSEWDKLDQAQEVQAAADELTEEMKAESVLRQLTYSAVIMVADFFDPQRTDVPIKKTSKTEDMPPQFPTLRKFCLMNSAIIEPLLVFMSHAIRMHDGRCCGVVLKVFRSIIPEFRGVDSQGHSLPPVEPARNAPISDNFPIPLETTYAVREYICTEILKACISSLHEHHFVDLQRELGNVIAAIVANYSQLTQTPREILSSLPNMQQQEVDDCFAKIIQQGTSQRAQRVLVLGLLKDLKGVSIAEMGKVQKSTDFGIAKKKASTRSEMQQQFMEAPTNGQADRERERERNSPDLIGIAGLFDS